MVHQIAQEGALCPSVMVTLGPHWRKVKCMILKILIITYTYIRLVNGIFKYKNHYLFES